MLTGVLMNPVLSILVTPCALEQGWPRGLSIIQPHGETLGEPQPHGPGGSSIPRPSPAAPEQGPPGAPQTGGSSHLLGAWACVWRQRVTDEVNVPKQELSQRVRSRLPPPTAHPLEPRTERCRQTSAPGGTSGTVGIGMGLSLPTLVVPRSGRWGPEGRAGPWHNMTRALSAWR